MQNENYTVFKYYSAKEALACTETTKLDLAILDIMMPEINGFSLCQKIREQFTFPIIMLTAKDEETDKITGLTLGADDYITKPFRPLELVARVKAQIRRYKKYNSAKALEETRFVLSYSGLELNTKTHECLLNLSPRHSREGGNPCFIRPEFFAPPGIFPKKRKARKPLGFRAFRVVIKTKATSFSRDALHRP